MILKNISSYYTCLNYVHYMYSNIVIEKNSGKDNSEKLIIVKTIFCAVSNEGDLKKRMKLPLLKK